MSSNTLRTLLERAEILIPSEDRKSYPLYHKDLKSLEERTTKLAASLKSTSEKQAEAHYFLNSNGIDTTRLSTPAKFDNFFQTFEIQHNTNLEKYLDEKLEKIYKEIIGEQRKVETTEQLHEKQPEDEASAMEEERAEAEEDAQDYREFEQYNNSMGAVRINDYAAIITKLNENRLANEDYNLIEHLASQFNTSELQKWQDSATEAWQIVDYLVHHALTEDMDEDLRLEGRSIKGCNADDIQSAAAVRTRRQLIQSSKSWLEEKYMRSINDYLNRNATKIQMGGIPSYSYRLWAFIEHVYKSSSTPGWADQRLELKNDKPVWVFIYHLLRSGQYELAMKYVDENRELFTTERDFPAYFNEYITSEDNCVSKATQHAILSDYHRFEYGEGLTDPYKTLIYKIMGRCELYKKKSIDVIQTYEDYIWLQMMLIREATDVERYEAERYRLFDLQLQISSLGSEYYDPENTNPWIYFRILLLTLQFEKAIHFLHNQKRLQLEAVHFAIALYYCGLIRIHRQSKESLFEKKRREPLLIEDARERSVCYLNIARLLEKYVSVYIQDSLKNALQYLFILTIYSPQHGYVDYSMVEIAKHQIHKYAMKKRAFKPLLGDISNNQRTPGLVEQQAALLGINTDKEYAEQILCPVAELCVRSGYCSDAVYIYSLSGDFNKMVDVLAKELSDALQQPQSYRTTDPSLSTASNEEIINFAMQTLTYYENNEAFATAIDSQRHHTIRVLIQLLRFRDLYEKGHYETAMQILEEANVIPLTHNFQHIQMLVNQFNNTLDDIVRKNVPELLLNAMDILYKTWSAHLTTRSVPESEIDALEKKARAVLTFAGMVQFYIPSDIIIRLNKVDMLMETKRKSL